MFADVYERFAPVLEEFEGDDDAGNDENADEGDDEKEEGGPAEPVPVTPEPAAPSELTPLIVAMDFMIQDSQPEGSGMKIDPADHSSMSAEEFDAMTDKVNKVIKMLRIAEAHNPCMFRAIKLWSQVA